MDHYVATTHYEGDILVVDIDGPTTGVTQACYPGEVGRMARDWIETMTERDDFTVEVIDPTGAVAAWEGLPRGRRALDVGWHAVRVWMYQHNPITRYQLRKAPAMTRDPAGHLLRSRPQRAAAAVHQFCRRHGLPRAHWCVFDRHCRFYGAPWRVTLLWGRHSAWVDMELVWPPISGGRYARPREEGTGHRAR